MINKEKKNDCVKLKKEIQNEMEREFRNLNDIERNNEIVKGLKGNPLFEKFFDVHPERFPGKKEAA